MQRILRFWRFERQFGFAAVDCRSSEKQKAACTICFPCKTLNPNSRPVLSPRGRELERGQQTARLVWAVRVFGKDCRDLGECPLPNPPPQGRERIAAGFAVAGSLKSRLDKQPLIAGRLKNKKQPAQPIFLAEPFIPTASRPLSRGRELERGQQAARFVFGRLGCWERLPQFGECPLPDPPPRGRERVAADSDVAGRLKKNARNINSRNVSGSLYRKADGTNAARFFQTTFEPVGRVCAARHARGGLGLQGKWGTRAYCTYTTCGLRLATIRGSDIQVGLANSTF